MVYRIILLGLFALISCGAHPKVSLGHSVEVDKGSITIWTHDLDPGREAAVEYAASILRNEVFDHPNCPSVAVVSENTGIMRPGINVYDSSNAPGTEFNECRQPYAAITKDKSKGIVNLCSHYIWGWAHALDPNIYMATNQIARVMGLPQTGSNGIGRASYTSSDRVVLQAQSMSSQSLWFGFYDHEVELLRGKYCR